MKIDSAYAGILSLVILLSFSLGVVAQTQNSFCSLSGSGTSEFAKLGMDLTFVIAHQEPLPFILENQTGSIIKFGCKDGKDGQGYYIPSKVKSDQYIFVIHEWWGLNDYIKREAENMAIAFPNAHILALDIYDGKVATTREEAAASMQSVTQERAENIVHGASEWSGKSAKIATIGWCFGGAWSLKSSILLEEKAVACVIYYGMPVQNEAELKQLKAPVLGIFATQDGWITQKVVQDFEDQMKTLGKSVDIHFYEAVHAFANPSNPGFDKVATEDAGTKTMAFLKKHL
ncbi:MAG: dienelactone hydrolase family protein [Saprospiraceae bacterium]|nr:dienelactone hydrolase family protein [Saprospiraceae bacterium]